MQNPPHPSEIESPDTRGDPRDESLLRWLAATADGDQAAFAALYQATAGRLYGLCLRILHEEGRAQECLQDVFLAVWQQAGRFDAARARPMTWLAAIAHHRAISLLRRFDREITAPDWAEFLLRAEVPDDAEPSQRAQPEQDWQLLDAAALDRCLQRLRAEPRQAVQHAFWFGQTYQEIADELALSINTVKSWIRRALAELKSCLGVGVMP
ncbi:sigma-70 family RNA polymerase sigma factor [Halothiobacillus sp. DCM-1]|uniref:sigma-70 family RNA polymerase sigma factor n=1 Tax=Halothiobacillus sp. DCM-1 TaxID=3112558 RepID=UPI003254E966